MKKLWIVNLSGSKKLKNGAYLRTNLNNKKFYFKVYSFGTGIVIKNNILSSASRFGKNIFEADPSIQWVENNDHEKVQILKSN